jgi:hypothetical protein
MTLLIPVFTTALAVYFKVNGWPPGWFWLTASFAVLQWLILVVSVTVSA